MKILILIICQLLSTGSNRTTGQASYYHDKYEGRRTASGKIFHQRYAYAAHATFPFGTMVRVHNLDNGRSWVVEIVDRGPFNVELAKQGILKPHPSRVIDVSKETARMLGFVKQGICNVHIEVIPVPGGHCRSPPERE